MSTRFIKLYNSLPAEAQQTLVEKHLAGLLDNVSKDKSKKVMLAATRLQTKYSKTPVLDLRAKKKQIGELLEDLAKDAKIAFVPERSHRDELLSEIVHGLLSWLDVIWSVVYEHNAQFAIAHRCLLFVAEALAQLSERSNLGGCKCTLMNLPIDFALKDNAGKVLKRFSVRGPQKVDQILLWIWRDLFVSLFATGSKHDKETVPTFLEDIQDVLGLNSLERLLNGGRPSSDDVSEDDFGFEDEDEDEEDDEEDEDEEDEDEDEDEDEEDEDEDEDEEDYDDEDEDEDAYSDSDNTDARCTCKLHARYWTEQINKERISLRDCVEKRLFAVFKQAPSLRIFRSLISISMESDQLIDELMEVLEDIAGDSPENLVAALEIYIYDADFGQIVNLLEKYIHLLRPRDMVTLQCAVALLAETSHRQLALSIFEAELEDSFQAIYFAVSACFAHIEESANKAELVAILKVKPGSPGRKSRIETWAGRVISSSNPSMGPMAFAAIMMGLPILPGSDEGDDSDILNYVDLDRNDADFDDLREEFRPDLKSRFDSWVQLGQNMTGGKALLMKQYAKVIELMPYLRSQDVINEMVGRMRQKGPSKHYVLEGLNNLGSFAKMQRKKINLVAEKKRNAAGSTQAGGSGSNDSQPKGTNRNKSIPARDRGRQESWHRGGPSKLPIPKIPGGMEDVD